MSDGEQMPELDDFSEQLRNIQYSKPLGSAGSQDYTKLNTRHIEDKQQLAHQLQQSKKQQQKLQAKIVNSKQDYGGFKKGFLSSQPKNQPQQTITTLKKNSNNNPLQIKEVQQAMKVNNYLQQTRSQWMTDNFLNKISKNEKVSKLFSNPQYMKAIDQFKTHPKQAYEKYGNNKQFMESFQQFCKLMGKQFESLPKQ